MLRVIVRELELDLDAFEGPFDLLLTLVLKEELDLSEVDVAGIRIADRAEDFAGIKIVVGEERAGWMNFDAGIRTARADFAWVTERTVGEFDGKAKYERLLRPGQQAGEVVFAEKVREDGIRAQDWEVVRWTWYDLSDFGPTAARIWERFRAG